MCLHPYRNDISSPTLARSCLDKEEYHRRKSQNGKGKTATFRFNLVSIRSRFTLTERLRSTFSRGETHYDGLNKKEISLMFHGLQYLLLKS